MNEQIPVNVSFRKLKKIVKHLEKINFKDKDLVSFDYVVGSCFPNIYKNIQLEIRKSYTKGYIDGQKETNEILVEEKTNDRSN